MDTVVALVAVPYVAAAMAWVDWQPGKPQDEKNRDKLVAICNAVNWVVPGVPEVDVVQVQEWVASGRRVKLVDVREPQEYQVSMVAGGAVTLEEFQQGREQPHEDELVVCYCTVGKRSTDAARNLRHRGFEAYNLRGSILAWTQAGMPLVDGADRATPTKRVHTWTSCFALQGEGYEAVC